MSIAIRIAFREEGENWNAYAAPLGTLDGAIFLGSVAMKFVRENPERKRQFMEFMKSCLGDVIEAMSGERPKQWHELQAPEHERKRK